MVGFSSHDIRDTNPKLVGKAFHVYGGAAHKIKALAVEMGHL